MRAYKTVNDAYIEPISFTVPRRAETFQADIFPPATGKKPAVNAREWIDGKTGIPNKIDLESVYEGTAPKEVSSDYTAPASAPAPAPVAEKPAPKKEEPKREEPKPAAAVRSSPTMSEQKGSISAMASKYQDMEEEEDDDENETSSFEEVSRPAQRNIMPVRSEPKFTPPVKTQTPPAASPAPATAKPSSPIKPYAPAVTSPASRNAFSSSPGVESSLADIKQLLESQTKLITAQNQQIGILTSEVESLKRKVSSGSQDQSERIRQLELELEESRS